MKLALFLFMGAWVAAIIDDLRLRRRIVELKAAKAVEAFADTVVVDGVQLPKPEDERWTKRSTQVDEKERAFLALGAVAVGDLPPIDTVYVESCKIRSSGSDATKRYVAAVWDAYNSRVIVKSIRS